MDNIKPSIRKTNSIIAMLLLIEKNPILFLNSKSIDSLENFLAGFTTAQYSNDIESNESDVFKSFFDWLKIKKDYASQQGFFGLFNEIFDDKSAIEKYDEFYKYLNDYLLDIQYSST